MVPFSIGAALLAGFVATLAMSSAMGLAKATGMTKMPPFPLIMGTMMSGDRRKAAAMGAIAHYLVMGTVAFGLAYSALFAALDSAGWLTGLVIGLAHGVVVGGIAMPMMPAMHPRMDRVEADAGSETVVETGGEVRIAAPGMFGTRWGGVTPIGVLMGHMIYGVVVALVYGALA